MVNNIIKTFIWQDSLNSDGQQYHQNFQLPLTLLNTEKTMIYDDWNPGPSFEQAHTSKSSRCWVKLDISKLL
jgi:hypothetical protein